MLRLNQTPSEHLHRTHRKRDVLLTGLKSLTGRLKRKAKVPNNALVNPARADGAFAAFPSAPPSGSSPAVDTLTSSPTVPLALPTRLLFPPVAGTRITEAWGLSGRCQLVGRVGTRRCRRLAWSTPAPNGKKAGQKTSRSVVSLEVVTEYSGSTRGNPSFALTLPAFSLDRRGRQHFTRSFRPLLRTSRRCGGKVRWGSVNSNLLLFLV